MAISAKRPLWQIMRCQLTARELQRLRSDTAEGPCALRALGTKRYCADCRCLPAITLHCRPGFLSEKTRPGDPQPPHGGGIKTGWLGRGSRLMCRSTSSGCAGSTVIRRNRKRHYLGSLLTTGRYEPSGLETTEIETARSDFRNRAR